MQRSTSRALSRPFPAAVIIASALLSGACAASSPARTSTPLAAQPTPSTTSPCGEQTDPTASYDHVIWIWMENHKYGEVIGNAAAPYTTALANLCGTATDYSTVGSPSLSNYLGAVAGTTFGIADDAPPGVHPLTADNLFRQVRATGRSARSYEEAMPANCTLASTGGYAVKHNPAAYFTGD